MTSTKARRLLRRVPGAAASARLLRNSRSTGDTTLRQARFELSRFTRERRIQRYLRDHSIRRLHLGTGSNVYDGWLNTDVVDFRLTNEVIYLDATKAFPLPDQSFDIVFAEHMIEHLTYRDGLHCLSECRRVLRPGGRIRVATPSLERMIELTSGELTDLQERYLRWSIDTFVEDAGVYLPGFVLNNMFHNWGHRFIYDRQTLGHALHAAGFASVEEFPVGLSDHPELTGVERHMRSAAEFNEYETFVLEAVRQL